MTAPGWYPDPGGSTSNRYHDGQNWTMQFQPGPPPVKKPLNAFFVVLAALSAIPTLFFLLVTFTSEGSGIPIFLFLWSGMWTFVWYSLRHR